MTHQYMEIKIKELEKRIKALEQEPCVDMEEIREVMGCNADAETKCKMISNILTAKPHYFEKHEPSDDAISRQAVIDAITANCVWENEYNLTSSRIKKAVEDLPSVNPQPKTEQFVEEDTGIKLDEAIERYTSNAEFERTHGDLQGCLEFRQLAKWLRELKMYRHYLLKSEVEPQESEVSDAHSKGCNTCKHQLKFMCSEWKECHNYSKYEPKESEDK